MGRLWLLGLVAACHGAPADVVWTTPTARGIQGNYGSMPVGNGRQGANVYAEESGAITITLSHVDALDENAILSKVGRLVLTPRAAQGLQFESISYHNQNVTVIAKLGAVTARIWIDADRPVLRAETCGAEHTVQLRQVLWRNGSSAGPNEHGTYCNASAVIIHPDTLANVGDNSSLAWYHWNDPRWTGSFERDLVAQGMPKSAKALPANPMANLTFGGVATLSRPARRIDPVTLVTSEASSCNTLSVAVDVQYSTREGTEHFLAELKARSNQPADTTAHNQVWNDFFAASDITVNPSSRPNDTARAALAANVTFMDRLQRAMLHLNSGGRVSAVKFNDFGIFSVGDENPDGRVWGACQWFQNIRLPYYHMLASGSPDDMKSLFEFYKRILPVSMARVSEWYNESGAFFPETATQAGVYASGGLGWGCVPAAPHLSSNSFIRYHREGGLELSLMALDWYDHTQDAAYFDATLLPQIKAYVAYYAEHFNPAGALEIYPAQALETWQCPDVPASKAQCVTNPMPEVAGLHAVLPRLLALDLNTSLVPEATVASWRSLLARLPPLPSTPGDGSVPAVLTAGSMLPPKTSNAENAELYVSSLSSLAVGLIWCVVQAVHPYRMIGIRANTTLGIATYRARRFHGDTGWSQDFMDAALLGLGNEAADLAASRSIRAPYSAVRFPAFQDGIGAGGAITDHPGVTTAGLRYMLVQSRIAGLDENAVIVLPAWPCEDWAVSFKLHAPQATVIEGNYDGNGTLSLFKVTPEARRKDMSFGSCIKRVVTAR